MQDFIYHMTLKPHLITIFDSKSQYFSIRKRAFLMDVNAYRYETHAGNLHIYSTSGLSFLMHDVIIGINFISMFGKKSSLDKISYSM